MRRFDPVAYVVFLFTTPSAFRDNWLAYARNVALHIALVGCLSAQLGFVAGAIVYAAWEGAQWAFEKGDASDCIEDWAFVQTGALAWLTLDWRIVLIAIAFLLSGTLWRRMNQVSPPQG